MDEKKMEGWSPEKVLVKNKETGKTHWAWPVDARELVQSGEYETPDWGDPGKPLFPLQSGVRPTYVRDAHPSDPSTEGMAAPTVVPGNPVPDPKVVTDKTPRGRQ